MYTQCPECHKPHPLTVDELRTSHGMMNCDVCNAVYDALELLSEGSCDQQQDAASADIALIDQSLKQKVPDKSIYWNSGCILLLTLLLLQIYYFEADKFIQHPQFRALIEKPCAKLPDCRLPAYKNLNELSVINSSFESVNQHYHFKTTIINQAQFAQIKPAIKLSLLNFQGNEFISRIFYPKDYSKHPQALIDPDGSIDINLSIATPDSKIAGYQFELI